MEDILDFDSIKYRNKKEFKFYRDFYDPEMAKSYAELLTAHDIPNLLEGTSTLLDKAIIGDGLLPKAVLKLHPSDFIKANNIILSQFLEATYEDFKDHYLNQLDDDELEEVVQNPNEWTVEDVAIAKIILEERGIVISYQEVREIRKEKFNQLRKGKKGNLVTMFLYFLAISIGVYFNVLFLLAGIGMGYYYGYYKTVDPDGNKYYLFEEQTRFYGKIVLFGGLFFLCLSVFLILFIL